jgi:hypothetical protein
MPIAVAPSKMLFSKTLWRRGWESNPWCFIFDLPRLLPSLTLAALTMSAHNLAEVHHATVINIGKSAIGLGHQDLPIVTRLGWLDWVEGPRHACIAMIGNSHKRAKKVAEANINPAAAPNAYTGKGGSKRD